MVGGGGRPTEITSKKGSPITGIVGIRGSSAAATAIVVCRIGVLEGVPCSIVGVIIIHIFIRW